MNVNFLLLTAVAILLMSQRYWGRMLHAIVFPWSATASPGPSGRPLTALAFDVASSAGVVALVGIGLALTWGWAPVYVWILVACTFLGGLLKGALDFMASTTGEADGLAGIAAACGNTLAGAARTALLAALLVWVPVMAIMLAALIHDHAAAAMVLLIQCLLGLALKRFMGNAAGAAGVGLVLLAGAAAVPLGILVAHALPEWPTPFAGGVSLAAVAAALLAIATVLSHVPRDRMLAPFAVLVGIALVALLVAATAAMAVEGPAAAYLAYFRSDDDPGAVPLIAACAVAGILPLLGAVLPGRPPAATGSSCTGATFEGLVAMVLLAALLTAPTLLPDVPVALPDWRSGIDPGALADYAVTSLSVLGARLPVPVEIIGDAVAAVLCGLLAVTLVAALAAIRHLATSLTAEVGLPRGMPGGAVIALLAGACALVLWRKTMPVDAWLFAGQLALWFGASVLGAAAIGAKRLRRPAVLPAATAAGLALTFWWSVGQQLALAVPDGRWEVVAGQAAVALIGLCGGAAFAAAIWRAGARQAVP